MDDSEIRGKEAELAALRKEAAGIVATASSQGRELTKEEDTQC
jgi:F0F1-type ATP synthase membrane subunit b/b'